MAKIFISYRRSDSEAYAGRLYDKLLLDFDKKDLFMDVDNISPGEDFADVLDKTLSKIHVMLVVIGPTWLTVTDASGRRRIDDGQDFVGHEIAQALNRNIAVIPVLVQNAEMPKAEQLPKSLAGLAGKQAVWVRHNGFSSDVKRLVEQIKEKMAEAKKSKYADWGAFGQSIAEEYNDAFTIQHIDEDYKLQLFYGSETSISSFFKSHMLKDALVQLIVEADVSGWMKHDEELQPEEFWAEILKAVALSYRLEIPYPTKHQSDSDLLRQLVGEIEDMINK